MSVAMLTPGRNPSKWGAKLRLPPVGIIRPESSVRQRPQGLGFGSARRLVQGIRLALRATRRREMQRVSAVEVLSECEDQKMHRGEWDTTRRFEASYDPSVGPDATAASFGIA